MFETDSIRNAGFLCGNDVTNPQNRCPACFFGLEIGGKRKHKSARRPRIQHQHRANFREAIKWQAPVQGSVQRRYAEWQARLIIPGFLCFRIAGGFCLLCRSERWQRFSLQSGDLFAQGKKRFPRRGVLGHGVSSITNVHFMFLWIPEASKRVNSQMAGIFSSGGRPMILLSKNIAEGTIWA